MSLNTKARVHHMLPLMHYVYNFLWEQFKQFDSEKGRINTTTSERK
jgi:hypothetical protein